MMASTRFGSRELDRTAIVLLIFVVSMLPYTSDFIFFHPDERHYVQGALNMLDTGEFLTPKTGEGEDRLTKPPIRRSNVVLPPPLGPSSTKYCPLSTVNETPSTALTSP